MFLIMFLRLLNPVLIILIVSKKISKQSILKQTCLNIIHRDKNVFAPLFPPSNSFATLTQVAFIILTK